MKRILAILVLLILCVGMIPAAAENTDGFPIQKEAILSALYEADIPSMREAIDLGLVSCEELTTYYLERISTYNKSINCFITICSDAIQIARQWDQALADGTAKGALFGIPIVIKDNINLAGYHTTNGHKKADDQIAESNAQIVDYLLAEGAVVFPAYLSTPLRSGTDADGKYWNVWTQVFINNCVALSPSASLPEITVPIGLHSLGCGIGMEIAALKNQEQLLLDIAYSYTSRFPHRVLPTRAPDTYSEANAGTLQQIIDAYKQYIAQPSTKPTEPTTQPTAPTTQPTAPTTQPTAPTTQPTAPTTEPTAPSSSVPGTTPPVNGGSGIALSFWMIPFVIAGVLIVGAIGIFVYDSISRRKD